MKYYKLFSDNAFIGVITSNNFVRYNNYTKNFIIADENNGELISYKGQCYRDNQMSSGIGLEIVPYNEAHIEEITKEEFMQFVEAMEDNEEEVIEQETVTYNTPTIDPYKAMTAEYAKEIKNAQFTKACEKAIEDGVEVNDKHYSLTTSDQLNLLAAENDILNGVEQVMYHADGEDYRYFSADEIDDIISAAKSWRLYNTIYLKSLKNYVNSLNDVDIILSLTYGSEIPEEFRSEALKAYEGE